MADRFLVFGDIHGEWNKLESLLAQVEPDYERDEIVFLGDYIDRGPEPKRVLDYVMGLPKSSNIHLLQGNHELMLWNGFDEFWNLYNQTGKFVDGLDLHDGYRAFAFVSGNFVFGDVLDLLQAVSDPREFIAGVASGKISAVSVKESAVSPV